MGRCVPAGDTSASGTGNNATGDYASVSGGNNRSVVGADDWRAGTLFENN